MGHIPFSATSRPGPHPVLGCTCSYPLIGVVALASVLGIYSSVRHLWTNPEVYPTRAYRQVLQLERYRGE